MADFLTRLASRTLGLAPTAEPDIAPMFAQDPILAAMGGIDEPLDTPGHFPGPVAGRGTPVPPPAFLPGDSERLAAPRQPSQSPQPRSLPSQDMSKDLEAIARGAEAAQGEAVVRAFPPRRAHQPAAVETAAEDEPLLSASGGSVRSLRTGLSESAGASQSARPAPSDRLPAPTTWPEEPAGALDRSTTKPGRVAPSSRDDMADASRLLVPLPASRLRVTAIVVPADEAEPPRRTEGRQVATPAVSQASPPTIEVTIGRVEVRAVHPPAPVARPKVAAPSLSLEEYLRNQHGGRR